ncbi:unnamed protein product, partial [Prorocentrum cordatum]
GRLVAAVAGAGAAPRRRREGEGGQEGHRPPPRPSPRGRRRRCQPGVARREEQEGGQTGQVRLALPGGGSRAGLAVDRRRSCPARRDLQPAERRDQQDGGQPWPGRLAAHREEPAEGLRVGGEDALAGGRRPPHLHVQSRRDGPREELRAEGGERVRRVRGGRDGDALRVSVLQDASEGPPAVGMPPPPPSFGRAVLVHLEEVRRRPAGEAEPGVLLPGVGDPHYRLAQRVGAAGAHVADGEPQGAPDLAERDDPGGRAGGRSAPRCGARAPQGRGEPPVAAGPPAPRAGRPAAHPGPGHVPVAHGARPRRGDGARVQGQPRRGVLPGLRAELPAERPCDPGRAVRLVSRGRGGDPAAPRAGVGGALHAAQPPARHAGDPRWQVRQPASAHKHRLPGRVQGGAGLRPGPRTLPPEPK